MCFCCFPNRVCTIISSTINLFVAIAGSVTFLAKSDAITTVIYMFASKQLAIERCNNEFKTENETSIDNCDRKENILVWLRTILLILMFLLGAHTYEISRRLYKEYRRKSRKNRRPNPSLNTHNLSKYYHMISRTNTIYVNI
ncbi:hypothetical protein RclHR1_00030060 [Rhizophagus clarus]|uniref:Uncharacterized protein n=1 Tax=Rhizophagus clarus TaxID=94130 RepID=A0A2Z6R5L7_9GLOM|nr:hypothetical protein RclHR1_00030060 [Rhizophagus clarus]